MMPENVGGQFEGRDPNPYVVQRQLLLDAIRQDKPHKEARRAGQAEIAALMGRAATHTGQLVTWDQMAKSEFEFVPDIDGMSFDTPAPPIHAGPDGVYDPPQPGITKEF